MAKRYACPTPAMSCTGGRTICNSSAQDRDVAIKARKTHASTIEAFRCYSIYLRSLGYTQVGSREFASPTGPILVLDKKSHFGTPTRAGKESKAGKRVVPDGKRGGLIL